MKKYFAIAVVILLTSCETNKQKEDKNNDLSKDSLVVTTSKKPLINKELEEKKKEKEKLEKLRFFLDNSSVTDENGIRYNLKVKKKTIAKNKVYRSNKIHYEYRYDKFDIVVSSYEITTLFKLYTNGKNIDNIELKGYLLESKRSDKNDYSTYCSDSYTYYPKLEDEATRKRKIAKFTGVNCGLGEEINNKVRVVRVEAVKACGILK